MRERERERDERDRERGERERERESERVSFCQQNIVTRTSHIKKSKIPLFLQLLFYFITHRKHRGHYANITEFICR